MTECKQIQKDILTEYYSYADSHRQKVTVHLHAYPDRLPDRLLLLFKTLPTDSLEFALINSGYF